MAARRLRGLYSLERLHERFEQIFGPSGPDVDERIPRGDSALFAVTVSDEGRLQLGSLTWATAPWALARARDPGPGHPGWLDGFGDFEKAFAREVEDHLADAAAAVTDSRGREALQSRVTGAADIAALLHLATRLLGLHGLLDVSEVRVQSVPVPERHQHDQSAVILRSFFLDDLELVSTRARAGACGAALEAYLRPPGAPGLSAADQVDVVRRRDDLLRDRLAPQAVPAGRWPAMAAHPLATSQQLAVNHVVHQLRNAGGLCGVNGPPGTGKTTMLRELLAAVVVERADQMVRLADPKEAFGPRLLAWRTSGNVARHVHPVADALTGHEIVVASANNEAVANVTREIPGAGAIGEEWAGEARYFTDDATRLLGAPAWGLVAAVLGNAANRSEFVNRFWEGEAGGGDPRPSAEALRTPPTRAAASDPGFRSWLDSCVASAPHGQAWASAVEDFSRARAAEQHIRSQRQAWHEALLVALPQARADLAAACKRLTEQEDRLRAAEKAAAAAAAADADARAAKADADAVVAAHDRLRPGWWARFIGSDIAVRWKQTGRPLWEQAMTAAEAERSTGERQRNTAGQLQAEQAAHQSASDAVAVAEARRADLLRRLEGAAATCGDALPDEDWHADNDRSEIVGPWLDPQWNAARTRVFLAALTLHEAFIAATAGQIRTNLDTVAALLRGTAPQDAPAERLRTAWQTLFLVVPSVSTTFASVGRLFAGLDSEALGWLLIDEAGQATPQAAVGAMFRARRVVTVGDPLQLEPIVGALHTTQAALQQHHQVDDFWLPDQLSVQALADRVTSTGTTLRGPAGADVWVGAPLRVHRRCDRPIFDLFNEPVYGGLMTYGKVAASALPTTIPGDTWFDVASRDADGNWIPAEGEALAMLLRSLLAHGVRREQVFTLTPFRGVAAEVRTILDRLSRTGERLAGGTVHTAQGKEAAVVVLVLGGDPQRPGAAQWAASKPNLFNVAVSRARERFYVIGDRSRWINLPYFRELGVLPVATLEHLWELPRIRR